MRQMALPCIDIIQQEPFGCIGHPEDFAFGQLSNLFFGQVSNLCSGQVTN